MSRIEKVVKIARKLINETSRHSIPEREIFRLRKIGMEAWDKIDLLHKELLKFEPELDLEKSLSNPDDVDKYEKVYRDAVDKIYQIRQTLYNAINSDLEQVSDRMEKDARYDYPD